VNALYGLNDEEITLVEEIMDKTNQQAIKTEEQKSLS